MSADPDEVIKHQGESISACMARIAELELAYEHAGQTAGTYLERLTKAEAERAEALQLTESCSTLKEMAAACIEGAAMKAERDGMAADCAVMRGLLAEAEKQLLVWEDQMLQGAANILGEPVSRDTLEPDRLTARIRQGLSDHPGAPLLTVLKTARIAREAPDYGYEYALSELWKAIDALDNPTGAENAQVQTGGEG